MKEELFRCLWERVYQAKGRPSAKSGKENVLGVGHEQKSGR